VNVSEFGEQIRVRVNFQRKSLNSMGLVFQAAPISDARTCQEFFAKLGRGLFIPKEGLLSFRGWSNCMIQGGNVPAAGDGSDRKPPAAAAV
jgi:hypothetical protein